MTKRRTLEEARLSVRVRNALAWSCPDINFDMTAEEFAATFTADELMSMKGLSWSSLSEIIDWLRPNGFYLYGQQKYSSSSITGLSCPKADSPTHVPRHVALRDWFAGQALNVVLASGPPDAPTKGTTMRIAQACYDMADAMLELRQGPAETLAETDRNPEEEV